MGGGGWKVLGEGGGCSKSTTATILTYIDVKGPDGIVAVDSLSWEEDSEGTVVRSVTVTIGPVPGTLGLPCLREIGNHDNGGGTQLPDHPPEINHGVVRGPLSNHQGEKSMDI